MAKKSVASASGKKQKRARAVMDRTVVQSYLAELVASLGDDDAFMKVFNRLQDDKAVHQAEAVGIGCEFVAPMAASTTKSKVLERILKRHKNLVSFKRRQKAVGGRSAA